MSFFSSAPELLEPCIYARLVGRYLEPPSPITIDELADETTFFEDPTPPSYLDLIRLLSGLLDDFLHFSGQEHAKWLSDIAHDLCDPTDERGALFIRVGMGTPQQWRPVSVSPA
ncbi:hypothetical protein DXG03_000415 [Asterophora parasitica]|uniref:Uncharacterized protein n=1 Tax=Asterophora parasitica TaxID=117018 RepID=A0A9P7GHT0_9AGAR|nr:hypothetical protein DXG03_000415 [Asterophora parasitica]